MILEEARINIPDFDIIWNSFQKGFISAKKGTQPSESFGLEFWKFTINNMKVPNSAFFSSFTAHVELYLVPHEDMYVNLRSDFNDASVNPQMKLDANGKIENIEVKFRIASSKKHLFDDILPDFYHELTHAYEFWGKLKNGTKPKDLLKGQKYDLKTLQNITSNPKFSPLEKNLAILFYFINPAEYNGRLNTFYGEIKNKNLSGDYETIIQSTRVWRNITFLYNVIFYMGHVQVASDQKKLIAIGNVMNQNRYNDYQTLYNDVKRKYNKLKRDSYKDFCEIIDEVR
jgi:hypothetical protein